MKIVLTGKNLTVKKVWDIAVNGAEVEIAPEAEARLEAARKLVYDLAEKDVPIYGFTTGVGWNKDRRIAKEFFEDFNRKLIYSHSFAVAPEASDAEVRAVMAIRLNCLLLGHTGVQFDVARRYAEFLNAGICPIVPEMGSVGEADLTQLAHIGLAMIGEGEVHYKGYRLPSAEAQKKAGLEPVVLGPKDALALVSSSAYSAGVAALVFKEIEELADMGDIITSLSLEGLNGNTSPLEPEVLEARGLEGQIQSAARMRAYLEGSDIYDTYPGKPVQDPLCFRGAAYVNGSLRDALAYAAKYLDNQMNSSDDNPCLLLEERRIVSNSNFETTTLATAMEMLAIVLSHVSRMSCYRMIRFANPVLTHLPRFLSHDGGESHCFGAIQKGFASLDTEIRHLANPCSMDYLSLAGSIEDHANNTPLVAQHLRQIVHDLQYIYGMELIHACQAIELRKLDGGFTQGIGTAKAYEAFRQIIPLYKNDRPLAPDVQKAFEFVKNGELLKI